MSKSIRLSEESYKRLSAHKHESETFSDVVLRLAGERSLLEIAGILTNEEADAWKPRSRTGVTEEQENWRKLQTTFGAGNVLLDTSYLIDVMRGDEAATEKANELEEDRIQQRRSAMTVFELFYGVARVVESGSEKSRSSSRVETDLSRR